MGHPLKRMFVSSLVCSLLLGPFLPISSDAAVIGGACSKANKTSTINKVKVICQVKGKKLVWVAVVKSSSTISPTPQSVLNLSKIAKPGKTYTAGKDLEPGYYVQEQNSPNNSCISNITHHYTVNGKKTLISGDFDTMLNNIGNLTHAFTTIKVETGDELEVQNCEANYLMGFSSSNKVINYPIYYGGVYIMGVNISPGSYRVSGLNGYGNGCVYSYSIASDPLKTSFLYGNSIMPRRLVTDKDKIAVVPEGSVAVLFDNGCGEVIKVS